MAAKINMPIQESAPITSPTGLDLFPMADGWYWQKFGMTPEKLGGGLSLGKNYILNSNMVVWQRGALLPAHGSFSSIMDAWKYAKTGSMVHTISRDNDLPEGVLSGHSAKVQCTTAQSSLASGDRCFLYYMMEGYDYANLRNKTVTLSFWVRASKAGKYYVSFANSGSNRVWVSGYTINAPDTWERKALTATFNYSAGGTEDYGTGIGLYIKFALAAGSDFHAAENQWVTTNLLSGSDQVNLCDTVGSTFYLTGVQMELGPSATDFEYPSRGVDLLRLQRYCQNYWSAEVQNPIGHGHAVSTTIALIHVALTQNMRVVPSLIASPVDWFLSDGVTNTAVTVLSIQPGQSSTRTVTLRAQVASGLTAFRPMSLIGANVQGVLLFDAAL
jgi:hypothetical protein